MTAEVTTDRGLVLHGDRVTLREFRPEDVDDVHAIIGDDRVTEWLSFDSRDRAAARAMLSGVAQRRLEQPRTEFYLAVTPGPGDDRCVGFVRLAFDGVRAGKLGYAIAYDWWGRGIATDAARTVIDYGFRELGLHRISAAIGPDNHPSIALVDHIGMTREGVIRDHVFTNGAWRDSVLFSVLADEWAAGRAAA